MNDLITKVFDGYSSLSTEDKITAQTNAEAVFTLAESDLQSDFLELLKKYYL